MQGDFDDGHLDNSGFFLVPIGTHFLFIEHVAHCDPDSEGNRLRLT